VKSSVWSARGACLHVHLQLHYMHRERVTVAGKLLTCIREVCLVRIPTGTIFSLVFITVLFSPSSECRIVPGICHDRLLPDHCQFIIYLLSIRSTAYAVSQEEKSIFWEVIVSPILSRKSVYVLVSYSERVPR
jgi:hypothetical protein